VGPMDKDVVREDALSATEEGYALEIRSHWYRSLPLTSLAVVYLTLDGEPVDSSVLTVEANGKTFGFDELGELYDEWWFITDAVTLKIPKPDAASGGHHRVELDLGLSIPYLIVGPGEGQPLLASSHTDKSIVCS